MNELFKKIICVFFVIIFNLGAIDLYGQRQYKNEMIDLYLPIFLKSISKNKVKKYFIKKEASIFDEHSHGSIFHKEMSDVDYMSNSQYLNIVVNKIVVRVFSSRSTMALFAYSNRSVILRIQKINQGDEEFVTIALIKVKKIKERRVNYEETRIIHKYKRILMKKIPIIEVIPAASNK